MKKQGDILTETERDINRQITIQRDRMILALLAL